MKPTWVQKYISNNLFMNVFIPPPVSILLCVSWMTWFQAQLRAAGDLGAGGGEYSPCGA